MTTLPGNAKAKETRKADTEVTTKVAASANGNAAGACCETDTGSPIWLIPAGRNAATEAFGPLWLAPCAARIVAVGRHNFLPIAAVAWISDSNEIEVAIEADGTETGRSVLIRVYRRGSNTICRPAVFEAHGEGAVAAAVMGDWDGLPVAGITFLSAIRPGEEL